MTHVVRRHHKESRQTPKTQITSYMHDVHPNSIDRNTSLAAITCAMGLVFIATISCRNGRSFDVRLRLAQPWQAELSLQIEA